MVRVGFAIVIGGILIGMGFLLYMSVETQPGLIQTVAGDPVTLGAVNYVVTYEGTNQGSKEVKPENTFLKIGITAKNAGNEKTVLSGGQFLLMDSDQRKYEAVYGEFSSKDLLLEPLNPNKPVEKTTQFDVPFDEEKQYYVLVKAHKSQPSSDFAKICILNCDS